MAETNHGRIRALWRREGRRVEVMCVEDPGRDDAPEWPAAIAPAFDGEAGRISFRPYPSLEEVRRLLPEYAGLWEAVAAEYRRGLVENATSGPVARQHAAFFDMPTVV
ncbi:hypothetical protein [Nocardia wallacei]|uniref:hypothetical protein n=1 Tax=Nocardia wallacei TaxID=480035 RepID=UPI00245709E3|nr:hypothetical protein [Nocardia wallacei]